MCFFGKMFVVKFLQILPINILRKGSCLSFSVSIVSFILGCLELSHWKSDTNSLYKYVIDVPFAKM